VVRSRFGSVVGFWLRCEYGELLFGPREFDDSPLDHGGLVALLRSGLGEGEGDMGRANALAVEL
jgi:hypothetical protein